MLVKLNFHPIIQESRFVYRVTIKLGIVGCSLRFENTSSTYRTLVTRDFDDAFSYLWGCRVGKLVRVKRVSRGKLREFDSILLVLGVEFVVHEYSL